MLCSSLPPTQPIAGEVKSDRLVVDVITTDIVDAEEVNCSKVIFDGGYELYIGTLGAGAVIS